MPKSPPHPSSASPPIVDESVNPWSTLSSREVYDNAWIRVVDHEVLNPRGNPGIYGTVHFKNLAIGVVPLDRQGCTFLVGQYRYPMGRYSWEIPEGGGAKDVDPLLSAQRELSEETGLTAGRWQMLLEMDLSNSATDEHAICFLAWDLTQGKAHPEEDEQLTIRRLPFVTAFGMVERGEITDAMSVAAILKVQLLALTHGLPDGLLARTEACAR
jgi:8-oxo-dGTP pyrophosphatase MutT (NUDIX family)